MSILTIRVDTEAKTATFDGGGVSMILHDVDATIRIVSEEIESPDPFGCVDLAYRVNTTRRVFTMRGDLTEQRPTIIEEDDAPCHIQNAA